jgi:hypothetical protein
MPAHSFIRMNNESGNVMERRLELLGEGFLLNEYP